MNAATLVRLVRQACESPVIRKLNELARETTGVGFRVFVSSQNDGTSEVFAVGDAAEFPEFCRLFHSVDEGRSRCLACHQVLALSGASGAGLKENVCHGGTSVLMAPVAGVALPKGASILVVSTCAISPDNRFCGWRRVRGRAQGLALDLKKLRQAYQDLPVLSGRRLATARSIVEVAAEAMAEALRGAIAALPEEEKGKRLIASPGAVEEKIRAALGRIQSGPSQPATRPSGLTLVDVVKALVEANPQMHFSVGEIARVARMTPNHFSMLFHRVAGRPFRDFLVETRLDLARELLQDLTLSILEVSLQAGFKDAGYFTKVFHKRMGQAPGEWRRSVPVKAIRQARKKHAVAV